MKAWKAMLMMVATAALLGGARVGLASDTSADTARVAKLPETAADHAAMAKTYDDEAARWRAEAEYHTKMAALYKASHANVKDAETMQKHCDKIAKDATDMAKQAQMMADYHRLRAKESM